MGSEKVVKKKAKRKVQPAKNKGGRPTKYSAAVLKKAEDYLANFEEYGDKIPSVAGLSGELDVCRETLHDWAADGKHPEFSHTLKKLKRKQERVLLNKGLSGDFNAAITKMALMTNHGYSEKTETENAHTVAIKAEDLTDAELLSIATNSSK